MFYIPPILEIQKCTASQGLTHPLFPQDMSSCLTQNFHLSGFYFLICSNVQVSDQMLFLKHSTYFNGIKNNKKYFYYFLEKHIIITTCYQCLWGGGGGSAVDLQNVLEEILSDLASVKTCLKMFHSEFHTHETESITRIEPQRQIFI